MTATGPSILRRIGTIQGPYGLQGEVILKPTDENASWVGELQRIFVYTLKGPQAMTILNSRHHGTDVILKLDTVNQREDVDRLRGLEVKAMENELPPPEEDEFYTDELAGLTLISESTGKTLGTVKDVLSSASGEFLEVQRPDPTQEAVLVPFLDAFISAVNKETRTITVTRLDHFFEDPLVNNVEAAPTDADD